jgi:hypothetical protein
LNRWAPGRRRVNELTDVGQEFTRNNGPPIQFLDDIVEFPERHKPSVIDAEHGNPVGSKLNGATVGLCTNAQVIVVRYKSAPMPEENRFNRILEQGLLVPLMTILHDVTVHPDRARRAIVNLSLGMTKTVTDKLPRGLVDTIRKSTCLCISQAGEL